MRDESVRKATGDKRLETGDWRQETGDKRLEIRDWRQETGDRRLETVEFIIVFCFVF